jgi:NAD-dependent dihydropyrimidine dehydrogenase PreA subunit/DNA-binding Lrp family transcriptional regulator
METDVYQKLARHLDNLPGGFPATESGVEQRILRRLFTSEDAELALSLTLLAEEPRVIARRARITPDEAARRLEAMEKKGLILAIHAPGKPPQYAATQFVVGIWEFQVNNLGAEFVQEFDEYLPTLFDPEVWKKVPQLRTIPVGEAIQVPTEVMAYERAEELVQAQDRFTVAPCICRREKRLAGEGCDKPLETCLSFGMGAEFYQRNGLGRAISKDEALEILRQAETAGLVLQPANGKDAHFICACCGCCCGVLRSVKRYPNPASLVSTPFVAELNLETCQGCGTCTGRCQMEAVRLDDGKVVLDVDRCIGCGLCVTTCPTESLSLRRKPESVQPLVPKNAVDTFIKLGQARGKVTTAGLVGMIVKSKVDRLLAPR